MINLSLTRIARLLTHLPPPEWHAFHIAGTNGKGSVAAYLSALCQRLVLPKSDREIRIGRFTSPHLIDRWDCITINDKPVSQALFQLAEKEVQGFATRVEAELQETPTEFEVLTATAFSIFTRQKCHLAVIECGLGGRLDATNTLSADRVLVSVITKIGLDHQGLLGDTVEEIARQKVGIFKDRTNVVVDGSNDPKVLDIIDEAAQENGTYATRANRLHHSQSALSAAKISKLPLHQQQNLELALAAYRAAICTGQRDTSLRFNKSEPAVVDQVIEDVKRSYPARLQVLDITPIIPSYTTPILLDGAHNIDSATILADYVTTNLRAPYQGENRNDTQRSVIWVLAASQGKDITSIFSRLLQPGDQVILTQFSPVDGMPWVRPNDVQTLTAAYRAAQAASTPAAASAVSTVPSSSASSKNDIDLPADDNEEGNSAPSPDVDTPTVQLAANVIDGLDLAVQASMRIVHNGAEPVPIIVAGSLYLASDVLRAVRDGPDAVRARF